MQDSSLERKVFPVFSHRLVVGARGAKSTDHDEVVSGKDFGAEFAEDSAEVSADAIACDGVSDLPCQNDGELERNATRHLG